MRPYSTEYGINNIRDVGMPLLWPVYTRSQTKAEAKYVTAEWQRLMGSGIYWEMHVVKVPDHMNVLLLKTPDGWRYNSFFTDDGAQKKVNAEATTPTK